MCCDSKVCDLPEAFGRFVFLICFLATVQPYYNLATVVNNATLEYQVGGANNLAELRRLKMELDRDNLFRGHGLVGL